MITDVPLMPDIDRLVQDALLEYVPPEIATRVFVKPPLDWADLMPFITVKWNGGAPVNSVRLQVRDVVVKVYALDQASGNTAIRHVEKALKTACLNRYTNQNVPAATTPGVLTKVRELSPLGYQYEGLTSKHPDSVLYEGMFRLTSAPLLP
ncbi:hypothetical protein E1264_03540 [Actinomadura sp. KC216]|uniref:hypothetical protein n=1 Tax=Actinomadura sp. KC216 TaxID=2530370 RepID=UPI001053F41A|nr:hypothetical protein [Actinomadura sp. KC216]TDB90911.1 hypothetical protein E1264_03540 [Actinomadura sp. KC216]